MKERRRRRRRLVRENMWPSLTLTSTWPQLESDIDTQKLCLLLLLHFLLSSPLSSSSSDLLWHFVSFSLVSSLCHLFFLSSWIYFSSSFLPIRTYHDLFLSPLIFFSFLLFPSSLHFLLLHTFNLVSFPFFPPPLSFPFFHLLLPLLSLLLFPSSCLLSAPLLFPFVLSLPVSAGILKCVKIIFITY